MKHFFLYSDNHSLLNPPLRFDNAAAWFFYREIYENYEFIERLLHLDKREPDKVNFE